MNSSLGKSLRRLGWGLVFPLVDFHLGSFDVLPDSIGYVLILLALNQLALGDGRFKPASGLAAALAFLSLPQLVSKTSIDLHALTDASFGLHAYTQGAAILHALLVYFIFRELYAIARPVAPTELLDAIVLRLRLYLGLMAAQLIFYPFLLNTGDSLAVPLLVIGLALFVAEVLLIRIPFRLSKISTVPVDDDGESGAAPL